MAKNWDDIVGSILAPVLDLDPRIGAGMQGCTPQDVATIERKFDLTLPPAFVALLARLGRDRGHLFGGADFGYPEMLSYRDNAEHLLAESGFSLDRRDFVYLMDQGYQFLFFRTGSGEDPAVIFYTPDDPKFVDHNVSFTAWLQVCMDEEMELWRGALAWEAKGNSLEKRFSREQPKIVPTPWWKFW